MEQRELWAEGRRSKAASLHAANAPFRGDWAFNTQPGHIPERARVIARTERAWDHEKMAQHHEQKAAGTAAALERSVFTDDTDALERLEERIAEREAARDRVKAYNTSCRKAAKEGREFGDLELLDDAQRRDLMTTARVCSYQLGKGGALPGYHLTNLGATIRRDRERLDEVKRRQERVAAAENSPSGVTIARPLSNWCTVTFAEKPERSVLEALRAAGYGWGGGSWHGPADKLPAAVADLEADSS